MGSVRRILHSLTALAVLCAAAHAQTFPARAIRVVVPYPPGGGVDITARIVGARIAEQIGQPVVIDNRAGAAGTLGADHVAKSAPDGHTLLAGGRGPVSVALLMNPNIAYVPERDFTAVGNLVNWPYILVTHPSVPARNAAELIALARKRPGQFNMASGGSGSGQHISGEWFNRLAGTRMTHVPYKGTAPAINDIIGGHADLGFLDPSVLPQVKSGRLKALGVSSGKRYEPLPQVPPIAESGLPTYVSMTWYGLVAPAATPRAVIGRLNTEIARALETASVREKLLAQGQLPAPPATPEQFAAYIRQDYEQLVTVIKATGIQPN